MLEENKISIYLSIYLSTFIMSENHNFSTQKLLSHAWICVDCAGKPWQSRLCLHGYTCMFLASSHSVHEKKKKKKSKRNCLIAFTVTKSWWWIWSLLVISKMDILMNFYSFSRKGDYQKVSRIQSESDYRNKRALNGSPEKTGQRSNSSRVPDRGPFWRKENGQKPLQSKTDVSRKRPLKQGLTHHEKTVVSLYALFWSKTVFYSNSGKIIPTKEMRSIALIKVHVKNWLQRAKWFSQPLKSKI